MTVPSTLVFSDQNDGEIRHDAGLFVDRTWKPKSKFVCRKNSLYAPEDVPATTEPGFRPNLNRGRVPNPDAELLKNRAVMKEPESEVMTSLRKAISKLAPR